MIGYYVTVKRGKRIGWLYGPFACHEACKSFVEPIRKAACRIDPWCDFDAFGTSSIDSVKLPEGILNKIAFAS